MSTIVKYVEILILGVSYVLGTFCSAASLALGLLSMLMGFSILYLIQAIIGFSTIWFRDVMKLRDVFMTLLMLLGGRLIPSDLLFSGLKNIVYFTPLPYVYDIPAKMLMGEAGVKALGIQALWAACLGLCYIFIYEKYVTHNIETGG